MLSEEIHVPLTSTLMLLQSLSKTVVETHKRLLLIVISQINMLICLISDVMDCKLIQMGQFK